MASGNTLKIWTYCGTAAKQYPYKIPSYLSQAGSLLRCPKPSKKSDKFQNFSSSAVILKSTSNDVTEVKKSEIKTATYTEKAKENAKTASYGRVIVVGVGVTVGVASLPIIIMFPAIGAAVAGVSAYATAKTLFGWR